MSDLPRWWAATTLRLQPALRGLARRYRVVSGFFPATLAGLGLLALCAAGFWFLGVLHKDVILLPATVALAVLVILMILSVGAGAAIAARQWKNAALDDAVIRLEAGYCRRTGVQIAVPLMPFVELTWAWLRPPHVAVTVSGSWNEAREEVTPSHRCLLDGVVREITVRDVLGMARVTWRVERPTRVMILPDRGSLQRTTVLQSLVGGEDHPDPFGDAQGDRVEMRQYAPGDPARTILWKVYARNRRLMVRVPERALTARPRTCAYMVAGPADEPAAALARVVLERRMLGEGWRFGADGSVGFSQTLDEALEMLARSGNPDLGAPGLAGFLQRAETDGFQSCLVFIPGAPGPWVEAVRSSASRSRLSLTFLTAVDDAEKAAARPPLWQRLLLQVPATDGADPRALSEALRPPGPIILCERGSGRVIADARRFYAPPVRVKGPSR